MRRRADKVVNSNGEARVLAVKLERHQVQFAEQRGTTGLQSRDNDLEEFNADRVVNLLVVDFYNQINLLYGSITEFCSPQSCPEMKATDE